MSEDEDEDYDEDEYLYIDDGPVNEVDDLAEHVIHSPVWHENDPFYEMTEVWTDREYSSDDYYDQESPNKNRRVPKGVYDSNHSAGNKRKKTGNDNTKRKRRKVQETEDTPQVSLDNGLENDSTVVSHTSGKIRWREKDIGCDIPIFSDNQMGKIALLKDWRDRFKVPVNMDSYQPPAVERPTRQSSISNAVLKPRSENDVLNKQTLKANSKEHAIPSRAKGSSNRVLSPDDPTFMKNLSKENQVIFEGSGLSPAKRNRSRKRPLDEQETKAGASQTTNNGLTQLSGQHGGDLPSKKRRLEEGQMGSRSAMKPKLQDTTSDATTGKGFSGTRKSERLRRDDVAR